MTFIQAKIGIVCPSYGYPGFLPELALSLLTQCTDVPYCAVFIDDRCPDMETIEVCKEYTAAYPDLLRYIRPKENGGLSSVRNRGVDYLLQHCPDLEGITFVDADDRLFSKFVDRCYKSLKFAKSRHQEPDTNVGWVFEDPYMIGMPGMMRRLRTHSLLWNLVGATQTSSSIFSIELFKSGLRYAEDMKHGGEDWEFSIRAYKAGFRAHYHPALGLRYRRRPGSMSSNVAATLGMDRNRVDIRLRHPDQYRIAPVTRQYEKECRHYCIINERGAIRITSGISEAGESITLNDLLQILSNNASIPGIAAPQLFIFTSEGFLKDLQQSKQLMNVASVINLHCKNRRVLEFSGTAKPEQGLHRFEYLRPAYKNPETMPPAEAFPNALAMSRDGFIAMINNEYYQQWLLKAGEIEIELPASCKSDNFNAYQLLDSTLGDAKTMWPSGIRPAYRNKEQMWRPAGMDWRDLPGRLTGLRHTFPELSNRKKILILTDGALLKDQSCIDQLVTFTEGLKKNAPGRAISLGVIDNATLPEKAVDLFADIYVLPIRVTQEVPTHWLDEQHIVSVASSFDCVVSLGTERLNHHSPALLHTGVLLYHKLFKRSRDFEHGRSLISMFKAYKGFICDGEQEKQWLITHGVPIEAITPDARFFEAINTTTNNQQAKQ